MAATSAANIAEALVIIPPGSIRWARRPTSSRWHLQVRSRVIRPGATQAAGPEAVSAGPARQFCARDSLGSGANPETCRRTRTWPARGPRANTPARAQSMRDARHPLLGYLTAPSQPSADRPDLRAQPTARHARLPARPADLDDLARPLRLAHDVATHMEPVPDGCLHPPPPHPALPVRRRSRSRRATLPRPVSISMPMARPGCVANRATSGIDRAFRRAGEMSFRHFWAGIRRQL